MRLAAHRITDVIAKCADICSPPASYCQNKTAVLLLMQDVNGMNLRRTRLNLNFNALPREVAELLSVPLECGLHRRYLRNFTDKLRQNAL